MPNNNTNPLDKAVNIGQLKLAYESLMEAGSTDRSVAAPEFHYSPDTDSSAQLTATREGAAGAYALGSEYEVLTDLKIQRDAKGHVTGATYTAQKVKDTNTTYAAGTAALLEAGTNTASRTWQAKILSDYIKGKVEGKLEMATAVTYDGKTYTVEELLNAVASLMAKTVVVDG